MVHLITGIGAENRQGPFMFTIIFFSSSRNWARSWRSSFSWSFNSLISSSVVCCLASSAHSLASSLSGLPRVRLLACNQNPNNYYFDATGTFEIRNEEISNVPQELLRFYLADKMIIASGGSMTWSSSEYGILPRWDWSGHLPGIWPWRLGCCYWWGALTKGTTLAWTAPDPPDWLWGCCNWACPRLTHPHRPLRPRTVTHCPPQLCNIDMKVTYHTQTFSFVMVQLCDRFPHHIA